ncbi:hypothetical protein CGCTS75_v006393 [Colletotrichum tropicale]|nr:hypothetical protein CGCTS75_v006393 [Colletotrichum tropicale]
MLFSKTILLIAAAIVPSVMAGCKAGAPFQGTCLSCTSDCHDNYDGPDRQSALQRSGCMTACLIMCDDC